MTLPAGTYDVEYSQGGEVQSTGELTVDGSVSAPLFQVYKTTGDFGISISSSSSTNRANLQNFIDYVTENNLVGIIEAGTWEVNSELRVYSGTKLVGRGMHKTAIVADAANWNQSNFTVLDHDPDRNDFTIGTGLYVADFKLVGADPNKTDNGGLFVLMGMEDFLVERMWFVDGSSYNIFVSGYGLGSFTNDITSDFWNSTFRGTVRDCLSYRGQIGFGTEGGAEHVLFQRCRAIGNAERSDMDWGLHGFRSASGYDITLHKCHITGYRQGVLLDRHKHIHIDGCRFNRVRNGIAPGSFYSSDPEITRDIRITNNYIQVEEENGVAPRAINDGYVGSVRRQDGVVVTGNVVTGGPMSFSRSRQINVQGNVALDSGSYISCSGDASGLVANNLMNLSNSASGVVDGGNNSYIAP